MSFHSPTFPKSTIKLLFSRDEFTRYVFSLSQIYIFNIFKSIHIYYIYDTYICIYIDSCVACRPICSR